VRAFLQQNGVNPDARPIARRVIAVPQLICQLDGIDAGAIDGLADTQRRYAFGVFDVRKANGGRPVTIIESWRDDVTAPQAVPSRPLPAPIPSSQVNAPSTKPSWPKQSAMDSFYGAKGGGQTVRIRPAPRSA
jgi:hypothetical protein